jgi:glycosyltransferase involved in cell wall biosynthesis
MTTLQGKHAVFLVENASVPEDMRVWKEARSVARLGLAVTVICPRGVNIDRETEVVLDGIQVFRYRPLVLGSGFISYCFEYLNALVRSAWLIFRVNRRRKVDVFHVANPPDIFFLILCWYRLFGAKYVFDIHDLFVNTFESKYENYHSPLKRVLVWILRGIERANIACTDTLVVTNQSYREYVLTRYRQDPDNVFIVRNAPPLDDRSNIAPDPALRRGRRFMLVYFGVMGEDDGVDTVLQAAHYMIHERKYADFVCYLIGPTEVERSSAIVPLRQMHARLNLESHVIFTGHLPWARVHQHLNSAHVGLSPDPFTRQNDLSTMIKIMEYMSHRLPIVSFALKENGYSAGEAAAYCKGYGYKEFGDRLLAVLEDESGRERMAAAGWRRYQEEFNWSVSERSLTAVYEQLARGWR